MFEAANSAGHRDHERWQHNHSWAYARARRTFSATAWQIFRSWLRTMKLDSRPSELVVTYALRSTVTDFLRIGPAAAKLRKFLVRIIRSAEPLRDRHMAA